MTKYIILGACALTVGVLAHTMTVESLASPEKAFRQSRDPLDLAEEFLVARDTGPVLALADRLRSRRNEDLVLRLRALVELYSVHDATAAALLSQAVDDPWCRRRRKDIESLMEFSVPYKETRTEQVVVRTTEKESFVAPYAVSALETVLPRLAQWSGNSSPEPVVVELYPSLDSFSAGAGVPNETVVRTGIVSCRRYGRIMILSPSATAFGYRWADAIVHEHVHARVSELSGGLCPPWLSEGVARYFETVWRSSGSFSLSPGDRALLARRVMSANSGGEDLLLRRMDVGLFSLGSREDVALGLAQVADAVGYLSREYGEAKIVELVSAFRDRGREEAFLSTLGIGEAEVEANWRDALSESNESPVDLSRGALGSMISFPPAKEDALVPDDVRAGLNKAERFGGSGRFSLAAEEYKKIVDAYPDNGVALTRLAGVYIQEGKCEPAEELLKRAVANNPDYAAPLILLGDLYYDDGRYEMAQDVLQQALDMNPFNAKIHEVLGLIAVDIGNFALARPTLETALRLDPDNKLVRDALAHMPPPR